MILLAADKLTDGDFSVGNFGTALLVALVASAVGVVLEVILGSNDDDTYTLRVIQRIARRSGERVMSDAPGILFLEIDGLALPVLRRAMRDGNAPTMARWLAAGTHRLAEWETDLSSQTGASQAGILLGSNEDISAFRWVEKETGRMMTCSAPEDCAEIERRHAGHGLLVDGGASRGNLLSGEADHVILTVSRIEAEMKANPGYRAFLSNGFNVTRALVLFVWEIVLEWVAALRAHRRDVQPRGHRGGIYPFMRAAMCVVVRDLIVYGVLTDMMNGRPAVYATFSSYDEVAHHSGLERADTLEALRKLDQQFGRIDRARAVRAAALRDRRALRPRPDPGRDLQAAQRLRPRRARPRRAHGRDGHPGRRGRRAGRHGRARPRRGDRAHEAEEEAEERRLRRRRGRARLGKPRPDLSHGRAPPDDARGDQRAPPEALPRLREHPHIGWLLVRSDDHGPVVLGAAGIHYLASRKIEGKDPLANFSPNAPVHLARTDGFAHAPDILVGSFYDPDLDEGCAFEELISFHGGMGGFQTQAFILHPLELEMPNERIVGAAGVHDLLASWRRTLNGA